VEPEENRAEAQYRLAENRLVQDLRLGLVGIHRTLQRHEASKKGRKKGSFVNGVPEREWISRLNPNRFTKSSLISSREFIFFWRSSREDTSGPHFKKKERPG